MKTAKIVMGAISVVAFLSIFSQSCMGKDAAMSMNGVTGFIMAVVILSAGLIGAIMRKSKIAGLAAGGIYIIGAIIGFANMGAHSGLKPWAIASLVSGVLFFAIHFLTKNEHVYGEKPKFKQKDEGSYKH